MTARLPRAETATTYQLTCGDTVIFSSEAATGDVVLCIRCDKPATITGETTTPARPAKPRSYRAIPRRATPHLHPWAPGYQLMRELLDATNPWRNRQ